MENVHNPNRFHSLKIKEYRTFFSINCTSKVGFSDYSDKSGGVSWVSEIRFWGFFVTLFTLKKRTNNMEKKSKKTKNADIRNPTTFPITSF